MELFDLKVDTQPSLTLPWDETIILPVGDIQYGAEGVHIEKFKRWVNWGVGVGAYFTGLGDYPLPLAARILTHRGFKTADEVKVGEDVLAYDAQDGLCHWTPLRQVNIKGPQPMVGMWSKSFAARSTAEHKWVTVQRQWKREGLRAFRVTQEPRKVETRALRSHHKIVVAAPLAEDDGNCPLSITEAELLAWIVTDGHIKRRPHLSVTVTQSKEPYRTTLREKYADWWTGEYLGQEGSISQFHFKTSAARTLLEAAGILETLDALPHTVAELSAPARRAFLKAAIDAEGWWDKGNWRFSQKPGFVLDAFLLGTALEGIRVGHKMAKNGVVTISEIKQTPVDVANLKFKQLPPEDCWCPTTDYGTWVFELDGQIGITGNCDVASPSGRSKLKKDELYDSVQKALDDQAMTHLDVMKRILEPTQGRWLVLSKGHHFWEFLQGEHKGRDTDDLLAEFLGCPTSATMGAAISQLHFKGEGKGRHSVTCQIWQHHGEGSGSTMAAPLNKLEKLMGSFPTVDVFLIGHYSRKVGYPKDALIPHFGKSPYMSSKRRLLVVTGGFMSGYTVGGPASYVERAMMIPTNLGAPVIYARPVHTAYEDRLDLNVLQ